MLTKDSLQGAVTELARKRLAALFTPAPDESWKATTVAWFVRMRDIDRKSRAALRVFSRTAAPARAVFAELGIPIRLDADTFVSLPPLGRVLLLQLLPRPHGTRRQDGILDSSKRTKTAVSWLPPALTSRGFVIMTFEHCSLGAEAHPLALRWGHAPPEPRVRLTDLQLAWLHTYLFPTESLAWVIPSRLKNATPGTCVDRERRNIAKARVHFGEAEIGGDGAELDASKLGPGERLRLKVFA